MSQYEFKADVKQVLDLVTHSLYSHKDVFLRELISNASDAIDKARFAALTDDRILEGNSDWKIKLVPNREQKELHIIDNGCGMDETALVEHLGTIAKSGTQEFLKKLQEQKAEQRPDLIGQFGVGFYSAFMVADEVKLTTRQAGGQAYAWSSTGAGQFTIEPSDKKDRGTEIILKLKPDSEEFLDEHRLRELVKKYSDFVAVPIVMDVEKSEYPLDAEGKPDYQAKPTTHTVEETLNSQQALWLKPKSQVSAEEYNNFYQHLTHDFGEPMKTIHYHAEGKMEFKALLFLPAQAPWNLYQRDAIRGLQLYINRVFIMDNCAKLLPDYLRFVKGVVDSSDLPLNVSRELLQENPQLEQIKKNLVQKILATLQQTQEQERETYLKFYDNFGTVLKEGIANDFSHQDKLKELLLFESSKTEAGQRRTLSEYVRDMPVKQDAIYYLTAENRTKALSLPQLEAFREQGMEVLFFIDPVDEWILPHLGKYADKPFKSIQQGDVDLATEADKTFVAEQTKHYADLLKAVQEQLAVDIQDVHFSPKLVNSVCALANTAGAVSPQLEKIFAAMGQNIPKQQRIFELNPKHALIPILDKLRQADVEKFKHSVNLLYEQALLSEGSALKNPLQFTQQLSELMLQAYSSNSK